MHNQPALAQRSIASMTMDSAVTNLCYQCGIVTHTDKVLADQCRLMTAILGQGWGRMDKEGLGRGGQKYQVSY